MRQQITSTPLYQQFLEEFERDCLKFTEGTNNYEDWYVHVATNPNDRLKELIQQIPDDQVSDWFDSLDELIEVTISEIKSRENDI